MRENADQKNSEYGHFSRSAILHIFLVCLEKNCTTKIVFYDAQHLLSKCFLTNFTIQFKEEHLCRNLFFDKIQANGAFYENN